MMNEATRFMVRSLVTASLLVCIFSSALFAQKNSGSETTHTKPSFKDTLDGQFDFSSFLIDSKGFMPIPMIITEPAFGNIGGGLALTFLTPKTPPPGKDYVAPDLTAALGMLTANGSWATGIFRSASFPAAGIKYRVFAGYASLNLSFYRDLPSGQEQEFKFNIQSIPILLNVSKSLGQSDVYLGLQYSTSRTKVEPRFEVELPDWVPPLDADNRTGTLSVFGEFDGRNNAFTADRGAFIRLMYGANAGWTGSDYDFQRLTTTLHYFLQIQPTWVSGFRFEAENVFDDPPFYLLPSVVMRGIPSARYQGNSTILFETEQRFDLNPRWSVVAFGGLGKAISSRESFADAETVYSYGTGFRYLIARAFGIRSGIDIARGPDDFAWYIVFGQNWNR